MKANITIPDNLNEVSISQYQKYLTVTEGLKGEFLNQRTVEVFCQVPFNRVILMSHKDVKSIANDMKDLMNSKVEFQHRFNIEGVEFGFIPDLEEMTSAEFADLSKYIGDWQTMHRAMTVMFRPIAEERKDSYRLVEYNGTKEFADLMKFAPLGIAMGAMVFFYNLANDLLKATQHSILTEAVKEITAEQHSSVKNGDSIKTSTPSLKEILDDLVMLSDYQYMSV